jgi:hypothetical protein
MQVQNDKKICEAYDYNTESYKACSNCPPPASIYLLTLTPSVIPNYNYVIMVSY